VRDEKDNKNTALRIMYNHQEGLFFNFKNHVLWAWSEIIGFARVNLKVCLKSKVFFERRTLNIE
jgi:hypothetical protein